MGINGSLVTYLGIDYDTRVVSVTSDPLNFQEWISFEDRFVVVLYASFF